MTFTLMVYLWLLGWRLQRAVAYRTLAWVAVHLITTTTPTALKGRRWRPQGRWVSPVRLEAALASK